MVQTRIENVDVEFPYEPYTCQVDYMAKVIQALEMKCDAALESPTGTGKTLSLLCSTLAWVQKQKCTMAPTFQEVMTMVNEQPGAAGARNPLVPRIYYCSRTHSQLAQVVRELNKTMYKIMPTAVLGSRDQMCIHDKVSKERDSLIKNAMCRSVVGKHSCHYYNKWDQTSTDVLRQLYSESGNVLDIEDIVRVAKQHSHCPFYRSRQMHEAAELVLLPYNYLIDPKLRQNHKIDLKGSIVIFDEAHNLESICEECVSVVLSTSDIAMCIRELQRAIELVQEQMETVRAEMDNTEQAFGTGVEAKPKKEAEPMNIGTAAIVLTMLFDLEKCIVEAYADTKSGKTFHDFPGQVYPGDYLVNMLSKANFSADKMFEVQEVLRKAADVLQAEAELKGNSFAERGGYLQKLSSFTAVIYSSHSEDAVTANADVNLKKIDQRDAKSIARDFKLYMVREKSDDEENESKITLNYWCFSATLAMRYLKSRGVRSVIVTSGTLSPLQNFMSNIGLDFGCTLENGHAANTNQVIAGIVRHGPGEEKAEKLCGNFANRANENYHQAIGQSMLKLAKTVPQGVLVFFSSYSLMHQTMAVLKKKTRVGEPAIWDQLALAKTVLVEPRNKSELGEVRLGFSTAVRQGKGAMFLAVCRGKVSEGIDFADADSRAVLIVGIPYPPLMDPRVKLKKLYLDEKRSGGDKKCLSGDSWYQTEGYRAVNQAIGRVLRHVNDFGVVALLDSRFASTDKKNFPSWMRPAIQVFDKFDQFNEVSQRFFRERNFDIEKSQQALMDLCHTEKGKVSRKRKQTAINQQDVLTFDDVPTIVQPTAQEIKKRASAVLCLADLEDEEVVVLDVRPSNPTPLPASFGLVSSNLPSAGSSADTSKTRPKKKIRLARNGHFADYAGSQSQLGSSQSSVSNHGSVFQKDSTISPSTSTPRTLSTSNQPSVSKPASSAPDVKVVGEVSMNMPESYRTALRMTNEEFKALLVEAGKPVWPKVTAILKAMQKEDKEGDKQQREGPFKWMKILDKILLPQYPKIFVVIAKYVNDAKDKIAMLEYAMSKNLAFS